jgi:uncharacterized protein
MHFLRILSSILFLSIVIVIYFSLHNLIYQSLKRTWVKGQTGRRILSWSFWILGGSFFLQILASRLLHIHFFRAPAYTWFGLIVTTSFIFMLHRVATLFWPGQAKKLALAALLTSAVICSYSLWVGSRDPIVRKFQIPLGGLPARSTAIKIVQLSDLHLEEPESTGRLSRIVDQVNRLEPDLIAITGDLIDNPMSEKGPISDQLRRLKAPGGVWAVSGNHDYYAGIQSFQKVTRGAGIHVLSGEMVPVLGCIRLAGMDDAALSLDQGGSFNPSFNFLKDQSPGWPILLLCHRPTNFDQAAAQGISLQLSGHTHGGQFLPINFLVRLLYHYPFGLYKVGHSYIYTSCGTGFWGPSMRFLSHNEIVEFNLVPDTSLPVGSQLH